MDFLFNVANMAMKYLSNPMLGISDDVKNKLSNTNWKWVITVCDAVDQLLLPLLVLVGTAGIIYAIVLGVNLARADSADKQKEAKQRMVNALLGLACIAALILLMNLLINQLPNWLV